MQVAPWLEEPPAVLYQTFRHDYDLAAQMCERHIPELERIYVDDEECLSDVVALGGEWLKDKYESYVQGSHRCDMWRYIRLRQRGGNYLDIKMALARPWAETLRAILAAGDATAGGQSVAQTCQMARQSVAQPPGSSASAAEPTLAGTPYIVMSIGANKSHIYQGNIWHVSPCHPLLTYALQKVLTTTQPSLRRRYLLFCEQLWDAVKEGFPNGPQAGWNWSARWGPVYLFHEEYHRGYKGPNRQLWTDSRGVCMPVDGHFMELPGGEIYAATRAWDWKHKFTEVALTVIDAKQAYHAAAQEKAAREATEARRGGDGKETWS